MNAQPHSVASLQMAPVLKPPSDPETASLTESLILKFQHELNKSDAHIPDSAQSAKRRVRDMVRRSPRKRADRPSSRARFQSLFGKKNKKNHQELSAEPGQDERSTLFSYPSAKITLYEVSQVNESAADEFQPGRSGNILGHGRFEVYQIQNKDITYFSCGSVVYPIMPRLKVLKISASSFIVPLYNPERYWKITLSTEDATTIAQLDSVFRGICHFCTMCDSPDADEAAEQPSEELVEENVPSESLSPSHSMSSLNSTIACFNLSKDIETSEADFLKHPTPIKLKSVSSSLDSILDRFQLDSDEEDEDGKVEKAAADENESTVISSTMMSFEGDSRARILNKRYSLTFKECDVSISSLDFDMGFLKEEDENGEINGASILKASRSMQLLKPATTRPWSTRVFGW
ncbi:hypothetical protein KL930_000138 [Ogataea haglerorum]|uniref:Inheritance of peroxisomes protein 1 n=1 Tax=Ogataea haglerorum TaxID=1937702 RepID=A0AAN6D512_9ASCO|nr:uncharacterized protein KL911_000995 [Ogataea haglerorum]KAG7697807.1 hypothetical protein KL951_002381 [Ogataea haglerorum]KAG7701408.1 hypothetical protein KL915_000439 [Ogataea haglerorum]KAG7706627.1 hypothetical protein KL950_003292 [Ogataea haglerorum]KAG7709367.1 hypothetical protein KL914_001757 [Ogataea haglerorum]KAG7717770.1 hypothetical protein KL913_002706 [Ogataea haglerorum]